MPRIRTIKPEALQHRKIGRLSIWARWLWLGLLTQADDEGRLVADPGQLRLLAFGYDDEMTVVKVSDLLKEIAETGLIALYEVENVPYACFPSWRDHQRIDRPKASKLPRLAGLRSTTRRRSVVDASSNVRRSIDGDQGSRIGARIKDRSSTPRAWTDYLETLEPAGLEVLAQIPEAVASTRKNGRIAPSVLDGLARKFSSYPVATVVACGRIYLDRCYGAEGKDENYLLGIIRREVERASLNGNGHHPGTKPTMSGQLAIERAAREMAAERKA